MKKKREDLERPTLEFIKETIVFFDGNVSDEPRLNNNEAYYSAIKNSNLAIVSLLEKFPNNNNLSEIYLKVATINALYSTNIYDTYRIAYNIFKNVKNLDERLKKWDPDLVSEIATGHGIKEKKFYSFATKYCSFHNPNDYPIYDSYIQNLLIEYNKIEEFKFYDKKLSYSNFKDYSEFKEIINSFVKRFNLEQLRLKDIDKFLWMYSKQRDIKYFTQNI